MSCSWVKLIDIFHGAWWW